jgi:phospholipase C
MRSRIPAAAVAVAVVIALGVPQAAQASASSPAVAAEQTPTTTPIKHFITLMQANHSFDNYFGTYPGADGIPDDTCMPVAPTAPGEGCVEPFHVGGLAITSLGHNSSVFAEEYANGQMNGFVSAFRNQTAVGNLAMGYYDDRDIPYYWNLAEQYVLFDRMFTSAAGGSIWNHFYWVTGTPGNPEKDALLPGGFDQVPTIFDRLQAKDVSWKFYIQNYDPDVTFRTPGSGDRASQVARVPVLNYNRFLDDPALRKNIVPLDEYYTDLRNGTLPAVSYIVPSGDSEHPPGSIQAGERLVRTLVNSLMASSSWDSSAFTWAYDDWGGWYDHVKPPKVDAYGYGFRTPSLLVSPYARRGQVNHTTLDFTSQLKFIETNWGVAPLGSRDAQANGLDSAFDFTQPPRAPQLVSETRLSTPLPDPDSSTVYLTYGLAFAFAIAGGVFGAVGAFRRKRHLTTTEVVA